MLGVGGLSLSLGRTGEGGGGSRGGGHLSRRMLLLDRPFFPRFLHISNTEKVFSTYSYCYQTEESVLNIICMATRLPSSLGCCLQLHNYLDLAVQFL